MKVFLVSQHTGFSMKKNVHTSCVIFILGIAIILAGCHLGGGHSVQHQNSDDKAWSFIQIGDLHAGGRLVESSWSNTINTILASNKDWNLKLVVSPGDCYEQNTNAFDWNRTVSALGGKGMTNDMWRIKSTGISWMNVPGNHDSDIDTTDPTTQTNIALWNEVFGTNFYVSDPYWFSNRVAGDTRDMAFKFTVGTTKMLFVGLRWINASDSQETFDNTNEVFTAYSTNCAWASNLARAYPDHLVIPVMHYFMDTNGVPSTQDIPSGPPGYINEGPGVVCWDALKSAPNLMMVLSGHVRARAMVRSSLQCDDGHKVDSIMFNTQTFPNEGTNYIYNGGCFVLYTVYPEQHYVRGRVFESDWGRFLTNGEFRNEGFVADWTFPFKKLP
jgi:hypothetical protein